MNRTRFLDTLAVALMVVSIGAFPWLQTPDPSGFPKPFDRLRAGSEGSTVAVQAAGRGNPWINLRDGVSLPAVYSGPERLAKALHTAAAKPLSLGAADFDEDGTPDLVAGYGLPPGEESSGGSGIVTLHRGNVAALFPYAPETQRRRAAGTLTDAPFLEPAHLFAAPVAADFLATGDFDGDGHVDVLVAARGDAALHWLPGDGRGGFGPAGRVALPGGITALAVGEINRRDGLADVVVGVTDADPKGFPKPLGSVVAVFEGPAGALRAEPEVFAVNAAVTGLALGQLDDDYPLDLAVAAGSELLIIHGRDRRLSEDARARAEVAPAAVGRFTLPYAVIALAAGDFAPEEAGYRLELAALSGDGILHLLNPQTAEELAQLPSSSGIASLRPAILRLRSAPLRMPDSARNDGWDAFPDQDNQAEPTHHAPRTTQYAIRNTLLVPANVSSTPIDNLLLTDPAGRQVQIIVPAEQVSAQTARGDWTLALRPWSATLDVAGEPVAMLPMRLNEDALSDLVILARAPVGLAVALTAPMNTYLVNNTGIERDGSIYDGICDTGNEEIGFTGICTLTAAVANAQQNPGADAIHFSIGSGVKTIADAPILPFSEALTINGQTQPGFSGRPLITLVRSGLSFEGGNSVVRGLVINQAAGINLGFSKKGNNVAEGNYLGPHANGTSAPGGGALGVRSAAPNTVIGGTAGTTPGGACTGACNLISGNSYGVVLTDYIGMSAATGNRVEGNVIGATVRGTAALANELGVIANKDTVRNNSIGGTAAAARNLVAGNTRDGIVLQTGCSAHLVQGNWIGVAAGGQTGLGNGGAGVNLSVASSMTVGGTATGLGNVISANRGGGVRITSGTSAVSTGNLVQGNLIGVGANGSGQLGNTGVGVYLSSAANNTIGGAVTGAARNAIAVPTALQSWDGRSLRAVSAKQSPLGAGNVIAGNTGHGVELWGSTATGNTVRGNFIGVEQDGRTPRGNGGSGVYIHDGASRNAIGGADGLTAGGACTGACNVIAHSAADGVTITGGNANAFLGNSIHSNAGLGIDLGNDGWTRNDTTGGQAPNNWQNYPALTGITPVGGTTEISGVLRSTANTSFRIEFFAASRCDATGLMQGETYLGSLNLNTGATGQMTFATSLPGAFTRVTATATRLDGAAFSDTSEFAPPDIRITAVEVTQVIQNLKNEVVLIADKPTLARVYVQSSGCDAPQVSAELRASSGVLPAANAPIAAQALPDPKRPNEQERGDLGRSLNFYPPKTWDDAGTRAWTVEVNPSCLQPDAACGEANVTRLENVSFQPAGQLSLEFVPVRYLGGGADLTPAQSEYKPYVQYLRLYPLAMNPLTYYVAAPVSFSGDLRTPAGWESLLDTLWLSYLLTPNSGPNARYYGVVDELAPVGAVKGIARLPGGLSAGKYKFAAGRADPAYGQWVMIHEAAHTFGRLHPGCTADEAQRDPTWPAAYNVCNIGVTGADGHYGFDYPNQHVIAPDDRADFMTYTFLPGNGSLPVWVSPHTYQGLHAALTHAAAQAVTAPLTSTHGFLAVRGSVSLRTDAGSFATVYRFSETSLDYAAGAGPYALALEDAGGQALVSHAFDLYDPHLAADAETARFAELIPFDPRAVRLALRRGGSLLAVRSFSLRSPAVTLIYPNGGESLSGVVTVRWTASDADGDPLGQIVQLSCDGGVSWRGLAVDVIGGSLQVNTAELPGGQACRFRVLASDGINTGQDQSDGVFTIGRKPPSALIVAPGEGAAPAVGAALTLLGAGSDPEDGPLGDAALSWRDSVSGALGTGSQLVLPGGLGPGWHTLTLTASDSDGMTGSDSVRVCVGCPQADLTLTKTAAPDPAQAGQPLTYTLIVANAGPAPATGVVLTDALPAGAALISAGATQGSCAGTATVVCALGAVQPGAAVTATVVVVAPPALTIINEAFVAAAEPDSDPWDNRALVQTATDLRRRYLPVVLR